MPFLAAQVRSSNRRSLPEQERGRAWGLICIPSIIARRAWDHVPRGRKVPCGESSMWGTIVPARRLLYVQRIQRGDPYLTFWAEVDRDAMRRAALVTGGTRGIGLGISRSLWQEGYDLAICGVRAPDDVEQVVHDLRPGGRGGGRPENRRRQGGEITSLPGKRNPAAARSRFWLTMQASPPRKGRIFSRLPRKLLNGSFA